MDGQTNDEITSLTSEDSNMSGFFFRLFQLRYLPLMDVKVGQLESGPASKKQ